MTKLKVAVRVRPLSKREKDIGSVSVISVENGDSLEITNIKVPEQNAGDSRERVRRFTFDYCFQESCEQDQIFDSVEKVISQSVKQRFHSCVLAYGQSSTGKTHTMMGVPEDPGLTPKLCQRVFGYLQETAVGEEILNMKVSVSYLEIYNEKVRDLLAPEEYPIKTARKHSSLKVREHPKRGPYVQGLSEHPVTCSSDLLDWLEKGNKKRKVAATLSNPHSSRSHSVFSVNCDGVKLNLIDLAGSERAANRCFDISRFKEGTNINKSLVALGNVISALAEQTSKQAKGIRRRFVPYRDSVLTWLLKDILGGNSNTVMVATVSPSSACYSETVNTLRFGQRAKNIISRPVVNEDPKEKTIRELRAEIFRLKEILSVLQISPEIQMNSSTKVTTTKFHKNLSIEPAVDLTELTEGVEETEAEFTNNTEELRITDNLTDENKSSIKLSSTEKLLPLINVSSSLKTSKPTTLKRTFSVDRTMFKMESNKLNSFGSDDSFPSTSTKSVISTMSSERDSLNSTGGTSHGSLRRGSLSKPTPLLPRTTPKRRSLEIPAKRSEKAVTTEPTLKKIESKVGSIRQRPVKPRAQIVAAVTSRLYSKLRSKEVSTDTDDINTYNLVEVTPKELSICENARTRLREISRKALRAHRNRNEETQTEQIQITRVKETGTDASDLKLELTEVKEAGTMFDFVQTKDVSVDCMPLETFDEPDNRKTVSFTRSCGTQSTGEEEESKGSTRWAAPMSFTKYLRDVQEDLPPNAIYTNSVNINISNNYQNGERVGNIHSEDSLENPSQNICLATPDLLSNHNSLEHHQGPLREVEQGLSHENIEDVGYQFDRSETFDPPKGFKTFNVAKRGTVPKLANLSPSVLMSKTYAPEVYLSRMYQEEFCVPFPKFQPPADRPRVVESEAMKCDEVVVVKEPLVMKSIIKNQSSTSEETETCFNARDSLEYHRENKKVQFSEKGTDDSQRMIKAMASFLEEATQLIAKIDRSRTPPLDYDLEVTVSGLQGAERCAKKTRKKSSGYGAKNKSKRVLDNQHNHEKCSQTLSPIRTHSSTQYDLPYSLPINKYEMILEDSCKRLEEKIRRVPRSRVLHDFRGDTEEVYPNFYLEEPNVDDVDDSSLDSHPVASSDYGSLPRKRYARRTATCSPSAFLRQLTQMRKQIVKSSRDDATGSRGD